METASNFIGGEWTVPDGAAEIVSVNPADIRETICVAPDSPASEIDRAVSAARAALPAWRRTPPPQRANIIRRAGGILAERKQALGELVTRECGKPLTEGLGEVQEAIETLNDCTYGLSSAIYTKDVNKAMYAVREIEAGIVYVNGPTIGAEVHMPFGGVKSTGNGHREAGMTGLDIFTEWKTVYIDYSGALQRAQIDTN